MRVDVHTHIWPDRIADAVADSMESDLGFAPIASNTVEGIKAHMRESGVDKSIVLGVAARADQVRRANDWLISIADDMLIPFGAVHPDLEDKAGEIRHLRRPRRHGHQDAPRHQRLSIRTIHSGFRSTKNWAMI